MITIAHSGFAGFSPWTGATPAPRGRMVTVPIRGANPMGLAGSGPELGIFATIGEWLFRGLGFLFTQLGNLIQIPVDLLTQGVDVVLGGLANIVGQIPIVGPLLGEILLFGSAVIKFVANIVPSVLKGIGNVLTGIGEFIDDNWGAAEKADEVDGAKKSILERAPEAIKDNVSAILDATGVTGSDLTPDVNRSSSNPGSADVDRGTPTEVNADMNDAILGASTGDILKYGIPAAGGAIALAVLLG